MTEISDLKHVRKTTSTGAEITVLNTGAILTAEDVAMLQALHSRSPKGVMAHLEQLAKRGSGNFMEQYYVGYGDKSIGDCGTTTIFIEKVTMLVAKAIQDWSLYDGQESSTRFIDFGMQPFLNPYGTESGEMYLEDLREFYVHALPQIVDDLVRRFPKQPDEDEKLYEKAIRARAFDIARGFLPAGAITNLSWHTNLRQAADHLALLRHHPLVEVRMVAKAIEEALKEAHPHSFNQKRYAETEKYNAWWMFDRYYFDVVSHPDFEGHSDQFSLVGRAKDLDFLKSRPPKTELPKEFGDLGVLKFNFLLDFGSFRDIQRHRAVYQRMPLLTRRHGFANWYLEEMPAHLATQAKVLLGKYTGKLLASFGTDCEEQNYIPMGYQVPCSVTGDLPSIVWLIELRATRFVHPTLRRRAIQMAEYLSQNFADIKLHLDPEPDRFDVKRGEHDIVEK